MMHAYQSMLTCKLKAWLIEAGNMDGEKLSEKTLREFKKGIVEVLNHLSANLGNSVVNSLDSLSGVMFSNDLISKGAKESPSFDKIIHEFTCTLNFDKTVEEVEGSCKLFSDALKSCGGPSKAAAHDLEEKWSVYTRETFQIDFIIKTPQQQSEIQSPDCEQSRMDHTSSQFQRPGPISLPPVSSVYMNQRYSQPMPTSSAQFRYQIQKNPGFQKAVTDHPNMHTGPTVRQTWDEHNSGLSFYQMPQAAYSRTKDGAWEMPGRNPELVMPISEGPRISMTDPSIVYAGDEVGPAPAGSAATRARRPSKLLKSNGSQPTLNQDANGVGAINIAEIATDGHAMNTYTEAAHTRQATDNPTFDMQQLMARISCIEQKQDMNMKQSQDHLQLLVLEKEQLRARIQELENYCKQKESLMEQQANQLNSLTREKTEADNTVQTLKKQEKALLAKNKALQSEVYKLERIIRDRERLILMEEDKETKNIEIQSS